MQQTVSSLNSNRAFGVANRTLIAAAAIGWLGILIHLYMSLDLGGLGLSSASARVAVGVTALGIISGLANVGWYAQTRNLNKQWLLIACQIVAGLAALYASRLNTPALMLIIGMAQVPARSGLAVISAFFIITNLALAWILITIASTTPEALVEWLLFMGFQLFAITIAVAQQRERLARESLATVNAKLLATRGLLAESARAEERLRVSRELHDIAGHALTAIIVRLEAHSRKAPNESRSGLLATRDLARQLLNDIRAVVSHLRLHDPVCIQDAVNEMCNNFSEARIHLSVDEDLQLDRMNQVSTVVRCIQEAVTNSIRHGEARNIWISIKGMASDIAVVVRDDGTGGVEYHAGNGLLGMHERLVALDGRLDVKPSLTKGWSVEMRFPKSLGAATQMTS